MLGDGNVIYVTLGCEQQNSKAIVTWEHNCPFRKLST